MSVIGIALSPQVQRVVDSINDSDQAEFRSICEHLADFMPALVNAGFVTVSVFYGEESFRYYDHRFPYVIRSRRLVDAKTEIEYLDVFLMLRADPQGR